MDHGPQSEGKLEAPECSQHQAGVECKAVEQAVFHTVPSGFESRPRHQRLESKRYGNAAHELGVTDRRDGINGEWLNLVEHLLWEQGVAGSIPVSPTSRVRSARLAKARRFRSSARIDNEVWASLEWPPARDAGERWFKSSHLDSLGVVQFGRAPGSDPGDRGFKSLHLDFPAVAQSG